MKITITLSRRGTLELRVHWLFYSNISYMIGAKKADVGKTGGYANNFGEPIGGGPAVDAVIITHLLKPLLSRFVESRKELQGHENIVSCSNS